MARKDFDPGTDQTDDRPADKATLFDPQAPGPWRGSMNGDTIQSAITVLAYGNDTPGDGPGLHVHPYGETFIVIEGRARFYVGETMIEAEAGEVVLGPKGVPHRFQNVEPGRPQTIDIHHSPRWIQTDFA